MMSPMLKTLVRRLNLGTYSITDPLVVAADAAVVALKSGHTTPIQLHGEVMVAAPAATPFERGVALGLALALASEPAGCPMPGACACVA